MIVGVFFILFVSACSVGLSPEEQAQLQALKTDLEATKHEISTAEKKSDQFSGGAIKVLASLRTEILKTNEALIQQRIHAIESGAKITIQVSATSPDLDRAAILESELLKQEQKLEEALNKASSYSGGLVGAMAKMAVATEENTLALLRQQYLVAKHGLTSFSPSITVSAESPSGSFENIADVSKNDISTEKTLKFEIIEATLLRKHFDKQKYEEFISFDIKFDAIGLDKPARAIKGAFILTDLFNEEKFAIGWTIDTPISPSDSYTEKGSGFKYNQFRDTHQWVLTTEPSNMKVKFRVDSILYEDGTTREF